MDKKFQQQVNERMQELANSDNLNEGFMETLADKFLKVASVVPLLASFTDAAIMMKDVGVTPLTIAASLGALIIGGGAALFGHQEGVSITNDIERFFKKVQHSKNGDAFLDQYDSKSFETKINSELSKLKLTSSQKQVLSLFRNKVAAELEKENPDKAVIGRYARQLEEKLLEIRSEEDDS